MSRVPLPRLCYRKTSPTDFSGTLKEKARLHPLSLSAQITERPIGTARMELPYSDPVPIYGDFVELFSATGSLGYWRVVDVRFDIRRDPRILVDMQHGISALSTSYIFRRQEPVVMDGETIVEDYRHNIIGAMKWLIGYGIGDRGGDPTVDPSDVQDGDRGVQPVPYWRFSTYGSSFMEAYGLTNIPGSIYFENCDMLDAMMRVLAYAGRDLVIRYNFDYNPWTVFFTLPQEDPQTEFRLGRNMTGYTVRYDYSDFANLIFAAGKDASNNDVYLPDPFYVADSESISQVGQVQTKWSPEVAVADSADLKTKAEEELQRRCHPDMSADIEGLDILSISEDQRDRIDIGRVALLASPDYSITGTNRITEISFPDLIGSPYKANLTIGKPELLTISETLAKDTAGASKSGSGGSGSRRKNKNDNDDGSGTADSGTYTANTHTEVYSKTGSGSGSSSYIVFSLPDFQSVSSAIVSVHFSSLHGTVSFDGNTYSGNFAKDIRASLGQSPRGAHSMHITCTGSMIFSYTVSVTGQVPGTGAGGRLNTNVTNVLN